MLFLFNQGAFYYIMGNPVHDLTFHLSDMEKAFDLFDYIYLLIWDQFCQFSSSISLLFPAECFRLRFLLEKATGC